jgi:hypothetical protein
MICGERGGLNPPDGLDGSIGLYEFSPRSICSHCTSAFGYCATTPFADATDFTDLTWGCFAADVLHAVFACADLRT